MLRSPGIIRSDRQAVNRTWFRKYDHARRVAEILERMTGDQCMVDEALGCFYVYRNVGDTWEMV